MADVDVGPTVVWRNKAVARLVSWKLIRKFVFVVLLLMSVGCGQANVPGTAQDVGQVQDEDTAPEFVAKIEVYPFFPAGGLYHVGNDHKPLHEVAYVDIEFVWSDFPHSSLGSSRLRHQDYNPDFAPCQDVEEEHGPILNSWWKSMYSEGLYSYPCCDFGPIDANGLGYIGEVYAKNIVQDNLGIFARMEIPDPASRGIHSRADLANRKMDVLVQAYNCNGTPFRPRRYCGVYFGPDYEYTTLDPGKIMVPADGEVWSPWPAKAAIIRHSFALPMRHGIHGTFPGCPDDVTATCGDNVCDWPEDEVNCLRDCNWVAETPP